MSLSFALRLWWPTRTCFFCIPRHSHNLPHCKSVVRIELILIICSFIYTSIERYCCLGSRVSSFAEFISSSKPSFEVILNKNIILLQCFNSLRWPVFIITDSSSQPLQTQCRPWWLLALDHPTASLLPPICFWSRSRLGAGQPWGVGSAILTSPRSLWPPDLWVEQWLAPTPPHPSTCSNKLGSVRQLSVCADVGPCLQCLKAWPWGGFTVTAVTKGRADIQYLLN